jgi:signal transduction histidine kinase
VGLDYTIQQVNRAAQLQMSAAADLIGWPCHQAFGCHSQTTTLDCECPLPLVVRTGEAMKVTHVERGAHTAPRYVDVIVSPLRTVGGEISGVIETRRDVTAERRLAETLVQRHEQLSIVNAVARAVNQSLDLADILNLALDAVLRLTAVDAGAIFLRQELLGRLELLAHRGFSAEAARAVAQFGMLDGSCGGVMEHGQVVVVPDLARYRGRRADLLRRESLSTLVHVPLMAKGSTLGSMCVGTRRPREFDGTEQELLSAIGSQIAIAIENARLYAEIQHRDHLRGELLRKVIAAQEDERKRIARELHDETSQNLTALIYAAEEALDLGRPTAIRATLRNMRGLTQRTLDGVHKVIFDLRPTMLDHLGLVPALRWLAQSRLAPAGVRVTVHETCAEGGETTNACRLPPEMETALFRVAQEAITNIARHAMARNVLLAFHREPEAVTITVEDDGIGFDQVELSLSPDSGRGLGLLGMTERIELLGGDLDLRSAPGCGTQIRIWAPIRPAIPGSEGEGP